MREGVRKLLVRFYPRAWRDRYGSEFSALLEESGGGWRHVPDVLKEGVAMRFNGIELQTLVGFTMVGLVIGGVLVLRMPERYQSRASMMISANTVNDRPMDAVAREAVVRLQSRSSLANLMQEPGLDLYKAERLRMPAEDVVRQMREDIRIHIDHATISVEYVGQNRFAAQRTVQRLITKLFDEMIRDSASVSVLSPPGLPTRAEPRNGMATILYGLIGGLVLGFAVLLIRRWPLLAGRWLGLAAVCLVLSVFLPYNYESTVVIQTNGAPPNMVMREVPGHLQIAPSEIPGFLKIRAWGPDRFEAQLSAASATASSMLRNPEMEVVDPPSLPTKPTGLARGPLLLAGLLSGLSSCVIFWNNRRRRLRFSHA
jgi:hypothetical protein